MTWTYDPADLDTETPSGQLNTVRLLIGDTDSTDEQLQDEEVAFSLSLNESNVYNSAIWCCTTISSKYARRVTTEIDSTLKSDYSDLAKHYSDLSVQIGRTQKKLSGNSLGAKFVGTLKADLVIGDDRVQPEFRKGQFQYGGTS